MSPDEELGVYEGRSVYAKGTETVSAEWVDIREAGNGKLVRIHLGRDTAIMTAWAAKRLARGLYTLARRIELREQPK